MEIDFLHPTPIRLLISFFLSFKSGQSFFVKLALVFIIVLASFLNFRQFNYLVLVVAAIIAPFLVKIPAAIRTRPIRARVLIIEPL